jgi:cell division control protein 6
MTGIVTLFETQAANGFKNDLTTYTVQFKPPPSEGMAFKDKSVFSEGHVPSRVPGRERQLAEIWQNFNNLEKGYRPHNMVWLGGLGTGKTVLARCICKTFPTGCISLYVNCGREDTRTKIIMSALEQMGVPVVSGFDALHYVTLFEKAVKNYKFVGLILDEADQFFDRRDAEHFTLFYWLARLLPNIFVVMLTNRADFELTLRKTLDPRILDTFRWQTIVFPDYGADELLEILWDRFKEGFKEGAYREDRSEAAALVKWAYDRGEGAREIISLALRVGEAAESHGHDAIQPLDIEEGKRLYERNKELEFIRGLPKVERTILSHILEHDTTSDEAYGWFRNTAQTNKEPSGYSIFQNCLNKLELKGLVHKAKQSRGRGRGTAPMVLSVAPEMRAAIMGAFQTEAPTPQNNKCNGEPQQ